jgi:O-acetyl-ADP-ribose deacetylase (regulator of RNase III)
MGKGKIQLVRGDITTLPVDAIVNAANTSLLGGGGVDGAIHRAAGPKLLEECRTLGGCPTGEARLTKGYNLPARFIIHTVGPVWRGGRRQESTLLKSAYLSSLELAEAHHLKSLAFPNISTGIYGFPKNKAAQIALKTVKQFLNQHSCPETVIFCCFDEENYQIYQNLLSEGLLPEKED